MTIRRIRLLPQQIPFFWEAIKKASVEANEVKEKDRQVYLNNLLHSLLNDKSQCFVHLDDNRRLVGVLITKILFNKITGAKELHVSTGYAWERTGVEERMRDLQFVGDFAKHAECKRITLESHNPRVWAICDKIGIPEVSRNFAVEV